MVSVLPHSRQPEGHQEGVGSEVLLLLLPSLTLLVVNGRHVGLMWYWLGCLGRELSCPKEGSLSQSPTVSAQAPTKHHPPKVRMGVS